MHSQQPPGVVQNWSTLQCSKHDIEQCGYDHAPVTRGRMRTQFPLPHGPPHHHSELPLDCHTSGPGKGFFHETFSSNICVIKIISALLGF